MPYPDICMSKALVGFLFALSSLLLAGCAERPQMPNWRVELRLLPEKPRPMEEATFAVRVQTRLGEAVTRAAVEVELSMPSHRMGENRFRARETEAGIYTGSGKFTMPGAWQVEVRVEKGGHRQLEQFRFQVQ